MESLKSCFVSPMPQLHLHEYPLKTRRKTEMRVQCGVQGDPWSLSDGSNLEKPKPRGKHAKNPLSDDNARRIIKGKSRYLSTLRRNQGPRAQTPRWIRRTPEQMVQYLQDDRNGHLYGKHVVAAIQAVRTLSQHPHGSYDMRAVMSSFVAKLTFREMCVVLKELKGWLQVRDFFHWMKLQLCYRPSVIAYTIVLRAYGQVGKIALAEETFLEMLDAGCEPDEIACGTMLCTYARWGHTKAMLEFYLALQHRGVLLSVAVYNFMLSSLQKKSLHQDVIRIYRDMVDNAVIANHFTFTLAICSLVKQGLLEDAFASFNRMKKLGFVPEEVTYSLLITSYVKQGKQHEALSLYEDMTSLDIIPSNYTCASLLTLYYKTGNYSKALSLFSEMERFKIQADEVIYGLLVRLYGKLGLINDAEKTFQEAERLGLLNDEKTYNTMAQVYLGGKFNTKALNTMEKMRSRNILFSRFAYTILLKCYVMKDDLGSAEAAFQSLSDTGIPDAVSCCDMLNIYLRQELFEKAKDIIVQIRKGDVEYNEELCRIVMKVYSKEGMLKEAEQFIEEISRARSVKNCKFVQTLYMILHAQDVKFEKENGSLVNSCVLDTYALEFMLCLYLASGNSIKTEYTLDLLLGAGDGFSRANQLVGKLIRGGDAVSAEILLGLLIKKDAQPQGGIASMIGLYGKEQKFQSVKNTFAAVIGSSVCGAELYNAMIDACVKCGEPGEAYQHYKQSAEKGIYLSCVVVSVLVNSLTNQGKHKEAEDVVHRSFCGNVLLDTVAYNTFIKAMLGAGKLHFATNIFERMLSAGVSPSIQTCSTMISVYGRQRKLDKVAEMLDMVHSLGVPLDEKAYTNLISIYGNSGKVKEASELFSKMRKDGIQPGKISYNVMMKAYAAAGLYSEAEQLLQAMLRDGCRPDSLTYLAIMKAYAERRKYHEAEETLISMQREGIEPSCAHFNVLISCSAEVGMIKDTKRMFESLLTAGLQPDLVCYRTLLRCYIEYGYVGEGISVVERFQDKIEGDRFCMSVAAQLYKHAGEDLKAQAILNTMNSLGVPFMRGLEVGSKAATPTS